MLLWVLQYVLCFPLFSTVFRKLYDESEKLYDANKEVVQKTFISPMDYKHSRGPHCGARGTCTFVVYYPSRPS